MGVYIKGMETPKEGEHPYWVSIHSDGTVEFNENKGQGWQTTTAVPVPPHGRLIDADAIPYNKIMLDDDDFYYGVTQPYIDRMPTIIPAEEA